MGVEERLSIIEAELAEMKRRLEKPVVSGPKQKGALDAALAKIWRDTPDDAWDKLPADFGDNIDRHFAQEGFTALITR